MPLPDVDDYALLGGELVPEHVVENPLTDLPTEADCIARCNIAMGTRMMPRAYLVFVWNGSVATVTEHDAVWGNDLSLIPAVSRVSVGLFTAAWPSTVNDQRLNSHAINLRQGWGHDADGTATVHPLRAAANIFNVRTRDPAGALVDPTGDHIVVFVL